MAEKESGRRCGRALYLECSTGISGDMAVAALIDAGADVDALNAALRSIPAPGFATEIRRVSKGGVDCCDFNVVLDGGHENHDHDMDYLFGHEQGGGQHKHGREHSHCHDGGQQHHEHHYDEGAHHHDHSGHHHEHPEHAHEHRGLAEIDQIIAATQMSGGARDLARKIFRILAEAEGKAHGLPPEQVHFHEVGAIDSIVDVIALAVCFDSLGIARVYVPALAEGRGSVRCQHGILPVPVPAVANIVQAFDIPLEIVAARGEFVTPTGAAFVAAVRTDAQLPASFCIRKAGMGAGKRSYERPSILRAFIIEEAAAAGGGAGGSLGAAERPAVCVAAPSEHGAAADTAGPACGGRVVKLESNIDDCSGEQLGFVSEELFRAGARDVSFIPCQMKKNRPGTLLTVICDEPKVGELEGIIFRQTTTIGIRRTSCERTVLPREQLSVQTAWGEAQAKKVRLPDGETRVYPEYESVAALACRAKLSYGQVYREVERLGREQL